MKFAPKNIIFSILGLLLTEVVFAGKPAGGPPPPNPMRRGPTLPAWAIDSEIYLLLLVAVFFGIYFIYKKNYHKTQQKRLS